MCLLSFQVSGHATYVLHRIRTDISTEHFPHLLTRKHGELSAHLFCLLPRPSLFIMTITNMRAFEPNDALAYYYLTAHTEDHTATNMAVVLNTPLIVSLPHTLNRNLLVQICTNYTFTFGISLALVQTLPDNFGELMLS